MIPSPAIVGLIPGENPLIYIAGILPPVQENPLPAVGLAALLKAAI